MCLGSQNKTMPGLDKNHGPACPPRSPFLCIAGLGHPVESGNTEVWFGQLSFLIGQKGEKWSQVELDLAQPGARWAWKALSDQGPVLPALGWALRGWERTDRASALGNLWSDKGDKAYNYERLCDSL